MVSVRVQNHARVLQYPHASQARVQRGNCTRYTTSSTSYYNVLHANRVFWCVILKSFFLMQNLAKLEIRNILIFVVVVYKVQNMLF